MRRALALGATALVLAACTGAQDTRQHNIFDVYSNLITGGYDRRIEEREQRLSREEQARDAAARDARGAQRQAALARGEAAQLEREIAAQRAETDRLAREIATSRARSRMDQQRVAELRREIAALQAEQRRLAAQTSPSAEIRQDVEAARQRQATLQRQWDALLQATPRE
jgi:colicin import membrane protein